MAKNTEYINKYNKENYSKISIRIPIEKKNIIDETALKMGKSINQLFIEAFEKQYRVSLNSEQNYEKYIEKKINLLVELGYNDISQLRELLESAIIESDDDKINKIDIAYNMIINSNFKK